MHELRARGLQTTAKQPESAMMDGQASTDLGSVRLAQIESAMKETRADRTGK
jgi:hypothetical protein